MGLIKKRFMGFWFVRISEVVVGYISTFMAVKKLSLGEAKSLSMHKIYLNIGCLHKNKCNQSNH
jgi:hypothetical protein